MASETKLFSARRWGVIWLNKFLLMWQWERISNSCPECDSYISTSSVTSFTPPSPHHCHSNRPGINITSGLIFFFHPERDVGLQWRKWVLALTPFKTLFSISDWWFSMRYSSHCEGLCFFTLPLSGTTLGEKQLIIRADEDES